MGRGSGSTRSVDKTHTSSSIQTVNDRFVVYGGGKLVQDYCKQKGLIYVTPVIVIKNKLKSFEKLKHEGIAFFGNDISLRKQLPTSEELFAKQVEDYSNFLE